MLTLQVIGNLGKDAELKVVNGKKVLNFSVAHTNKYKNKAGTTVEETIWVECGKWDSENLAPYLKKGQQVFVSGTPSTTAYPTKDGELKSSLRLNVFQLQLLGGKKEGSNTDAADNNGGNPTDGSDLPF